LNIHNESGKRVLDKLFRVFLKNGQEQWLLLHCEIQHREDSNFEARMFTYFYRIYDKYQRDVASIAVLADKDENWRPTQFYKKIWNSEILRTFEMVKLLDYKNKEDELKNSDNPFALVVMAQLAAMSSRPNKRSRLIRKVELFEYLLSRGWPEDKIKNIYLFIDTILALNAELDVEYISQAKAIEGGHSMNLVSSAERYGFNQGVTQGFTQGESHILNSLLLDKFNREIPEAYKNIADPVILEMLCRKCMRVNSFDEVFKS
jgi:hypothetical protein